MVEKVGDNAAFSKTARFLAICGSTGTRTMLLIGYIQLAFQRYRYVGHLGFKQRKRTMLLIEYKRTIYFGEFNDPKCAIYQVEFNDPKYYIRIQLRYDTIRYDTIRP